MTDERMKRLPAWAQSHITKLELELEAVRRDLVMVTGGVETNLRLDPPSGQRFHVPDRTTVRWSLAGGGADSINISMVDGTLRVYSDRTLVVMPMASNSVYLGSGR